MTEWQTFIDSIDADMVSNNFICDASGLGLILVTGEDAEIFLQSQLSNDISHIDESQFQLSTYSTAKGRMLAIFRIIRISNGFILITPQALVLSILQRLQMYVLQAKVALADASAHFAKFLIQTDTAEITEHPLLKIEQGQVLQNDSVISLHLADLDNEQRYLLLCLSFDEAKSLWLDFSQQLKPANFESWRLSEIKSGVPVVYPETSEEFVLQMSNLDLLNGVSFKKGCYPGQEIVARMHYLGKLKRSLFLATLETDICPLPGDPLCKTGATSADGSGIVVDAAIDENGTCHMTYIARIKESVSNGLNLFNQPEAKIVLGQLPYTLPEV